MEEEKVKLMCEVYYFGEESVDITWGMIAEETGEELNLTSKYVNVLLLPMMINSRKSDS